ncbi:hypothetical protein SLA2020_352070 [Shorea laevis]
MVLLHKRDNFLAEAERYIKENGPEALEKVIANECKTIKPNVDLEEIKAIAATAKKEVEWSQSKEPDTAQKDNEVVEVTEKKEVPTTKQMVLGEPSLNQTDNRTSTTKEIKGPAVVVAAARELLDIPVSDKDKKEWTCDICELTTESEKTMNIHLQGKKHVQKAKNQPNIVLASTTNKTCQPIEKPQKIESTNGLEGSTITNQEEKGQGQPKSVSSSPRKDSDQPTKEVLEKSVIGLDQTDNRTSAAMEIKGPDVVVAAARELPDIPVSKKDKKEWTCDICQLTTECEKAMNIHLQGKKHAQKAKKQPNIVPASTANKTCQPIKKPQKIESTNGLKGSTITNQEKKGQGQPKSVSSSTTKESDQPTKQALEKSVSNIGLKQNSTFRCNMCNISCTGEVNLASHFNGKKHLARVVAVNMIGQSDLR